MLVMPPRPPAATAAFAVGARSMPYLADHGFQDMVVMPGSFYVERALSLHGERFGGKPAKVRNVTYQNPIILSNDDSLVSVAVTDHGEFVEYVFYEGTAEDRGTGSWSTRTFAARLELHPPEATTPRPKTQAPSVEDFQATSHVVLDAKQFYSALRANGNQYGHRFQQVSSVWRNADHALGELNVPPQRTVSEAQSCRPILLDAATQLLAAFTIEQDKTFVLRSIDRIDITELEYPDRLWAHATWQRDSDLPAREYLGHVRVVDDLGQTHFELGGVRLALLDHGDVASPTLCVAATFTAEPLADSLNFWGGQLGAPIELTFSPYNQIFQQLLDPGSAFHRNTDGANVILLGLEDWAAHRFPVSRLTEERAQQCFGDRARHVLPNGLDVVHVNQYETDYVYKEIFEDHCYARHGIVLPDDATVVDIGANIGLFSLYVLSRCASPRIFAFEPSPPVYDLLKANCEAYGSNIGVFNVGVAATRGSAAFTFYENSSVFSGFHADLAEDREAIHAVVRNMLSARPGVEPEEIDAYVRQFAVDRLHGKTFVCRTTSVSDIIRDNHIATIDLLKIDAEKSELDILSGIKDEDWARIYQIVIEVHDRTREKVGRVERLLIEKGYSCIIDQAPPLAHSGLFGVYAIRTERQGDGRVAAAPDSGGWRNLDRNTQDFCGALRAFMRRSSVPLILGFCPPSPQSQPDAHLKAALEAAEARLAADVAQIPHVTTLRSASFFARYPLDDYADRHSHQLGHIPYTPEGYAAIGTSLFRTVFNLKQTPFKVIVLDCDNTLWKGVCGEDGPSGLEITPPFRTLQEFMIKQASAGRLLCLCSKNNERDVLDVFEQRRDMALRDEHFVSRRINWRNKSDNLLSLAQELNLGLETFIFVDDNPVECAEVAITCPGVLTLQLPQDADAIPSFLDHVWAFDQTGSTDEDRDRTRMYRENSAREKSREQLLLGDFIKGLQLRISVAAPVESDMDRISQLTFRTNQFNFTTRRRSEIEMRDFLARDHVCGLVARVSDRFGDYGLVGLVLYETSADRYSVDTFLLSCRVLGKGVEHEILAALARQAVADGKALVELRYVPSAKNAPVIEFLRSIAHLRRNASAASWAFAAEDLVQLEFSPDHGPRDHRPSGAVLDEGLSRSALTFDAALVSTRMQHIATDLSRIENIAQAIEHHRLRTRPVASTVVAPSNTLESALANIWRKALGTSQIGLNDNFFEAGGTSLSAVQVIAMIKKEMRRDVSIVQLFESPTVVLLAAALSAASDPAPSPAAPISAALRGQQRRVKAQRRKPC